MGQHVDVLVSVQGVGQDRAEVGGRVSARPLPCALLSPTLMPGAPPTPCATAAQPVSSRLIPTSVPTAQMPDSGHSAQISAPSRSEMTPLKRLQPQPEPRTAGIWKAMTSRVTPSRMNQMTPLTR